MRNDSTFGDAASKAWTRPQLVKLGTIEDVKGNGSAAAQGPNKS